MNNHNQPPAPPAGFVNDQQLPAPPTPVVPGQNQPAPMPPQVPQRASGTAPVNTKEPQARLTHVLTIAGWIPVDKNTISMSSADIMNSTSEPLSFVSEGKQIHCRASAIIMTKTKFE